MTWTTEKPTAPGWYWLTEIARDPRIVRVEGEGVLLCIWDECMDRYLPLSYLSRPRFAGPIPEPSAEPDRPLPACPPESACIGTIKRR